MAFVKALGCCLGLVLAFVTAGCGGSGAGTTASGTSTPRASRPAAPARGIKGESASEVATRAHLSASDCAALAKLAERQTGTALTHQSTPRPPLSRCRLEGPGTSINVYLDSGFAAHQRYENRITETDQFGYREPSRTPHPVPGVGEKAAYNADANWIPAFGTLLAVRGNRWLTVTLSVAGRSIHRQRHEAAVLARAGFRLSAT
jgi:hypothetical protein